MEQTYVNTSANYLIFSVMKLHETEEWRMEIPVC